MRYRVGGSWGLTIVREGQGEPDAQGRRDGDELVAVVVNGDRDLAAAIVDALNTHTPASNACSCHVVDVSLPGGPPEFVRGVPDGCPVHGGEIEAAKQRAREAP